MPSIKIQNRVVQPDGTILKAGSGAVIDTKYDPNYPGHSRKKTRESLGPVVWLSEDSRRGIFISKSRGLVLYDSDEDQFYEVEKDDPRISGFDWFRELRVHTTFGDAFLLLKFMQTSGLLAVIREAFPNEKLYQKVIAHVVYGVIEKEDRGHCDDYITQSFLSYLLDRIPVGCLGSDTPYYDMMGDDAVKVLFFKTFVSKMRKDYPNFGKGCYVDSTPLPGDAKNNPYNFLSSHGTGECCTQTRLALILDADTGLPVWYQVIPGNVLDLSTIKQIEKDIEISIAVNVESMVLDAGYAYQELFQIYHTGTYMADENGKGSNYIIVRMPNKKGYPYTELYEKVKLLVASPKYQVIRGDHSYFAFKDKQTIFGYQEYCYVFIDKDNALKHQRDWLRNHRDEYNKMSLAEQEFNAVEFGYFVLICNKDASAEEILDEYFGRTDIETFFKSGKEYLRILPIGKWNKQRVLGKILSDAIRCIVMVQFRKASLACGRDIYKMFRQSQSLDCMLKDDNEVIINTPNKQVRSYYETFGYKVPAHLILSDYKEEIRSGKHVDAGKKQLKRSYKKSKTKQSC